MRIVPEKQPTASLDMAAGVDSVDVFPTVLDSCTARQLARCVGGSHTQRLESRVIHVPHAVRPNSRDSGLVAPGHKESENKLTGFRVSVRRPAKYLSIVTDTRTFGSCEKVIVAIEYRLGMTCCISPSFSNSCRRTILPAAMEARPKEMESISRDRTPLAGSLSGLVKSQIWICLWRSLIMSISESKENVMDDGRDPSALPSL